MDILEKNIKDRLKLLSAAKDDREVQLALLVQCKADIKFFCDYFCFTYNPFETPSDSPFVLYDFQRKYISDVVECIESGHDNITEKSRRMGFSWMLIVIHLWGFLFKKWGSLYGSYKQDYVDEQGNMDSFFERCRYLLSKLPKWMLPDDMIIKFKSISSKTLGVDIAGDCGANFGTGGRRRFISLDEFAYWQYDAMALRKTKDVAPCRIFGGTPEGRFNIYGKIMTNHKDYQHLTFKRFTLHWRIHPHYDDEWYEKQKKERTKLEIAKELDINYDDSVTGAVYKDFNEICTFGKFEFNPLLKTYTGWDFGRDMTAIVWMQKDFSNNRLYIIKTFQKSNTDIDFFAAFFIGEPIQGFSYTQEELNLIEELRAYKTTYAGHYGDPYNGDSQSGVTQNTFKTVLAKYGIHILFKTDAKGNIKRLHPQERINIATLAMRRLNIDDRCHDFIQAIGQSRYPQVKESAQNIAEKKVPIHDSNSHYRTAMEYLLENEVPVSNYNSKELWDDFYS